MPAAGPILKLLYKYPQREFPYGWLVEENRRRGKDQPEFELLDTGIFDDDRYFDVFVEYAKAGPEAILMLVTVHNRGPEEAVIHLLPQLWFRNTWSWKANSPKPAVRLDEHGNIVAEHPELGEYRLYIENSPLINTGLQPGAERPAHEENRLNGFPSPSIRGTGLKPGVNEITPGSPELLFCDNETNIRRLHAQNEAQGHFKDAFHEYLIAGNKAAVNPQQTGTKAAAHFEMPVPAGGSVRLRLRLLGADVRRRSELFTASNDQSASSRRRLQPFADFDKLFTQRRREANEFYAELQKDITDADARLVQRQAFAGMIWSKQFFYYDVPEWIRGDANQPPPPSERKRGRNREWSHLNNADIISMPDKWEYP